jgi:hypothetical protein
VTSSWLASFVLIVVALGVMAVLSGGVWATFLFLSRWERRGGWPGAAYLELLGSPAPRAGRGTRS